MKIIVLVRQIPDPDRPIRVDANGHVDVVRWIANPGDEVAVDRAVELDAEVIAVSTDDAHLLSALARGAGRGYLVDAAVDDRTLANALVEIAHRESPDLILMGDGECGPRLAGVLDIAQATLVTSLDLVDGGVRITRKLPRSLEVLEVNLPAVVTLHPSLNIPKLISLYAIVDAREKPVESLTITPVDSGIEVISAETAPKTRLGRMVGSVDELVHALREEARVI